MPISSRSRIPKRRRKRNGLRSSGIVFLKLSHDAKLRATFARFVRRPDCDVPIANIGRAMVGYSLAMGETMGAEQECPAYRKAPVDPDDLRMENRHMNAANEAARFLIIDDHPLFREALHSAVRMAYPDVDTAEARSISEALTILSGPKPFDLALLDLSMPDVHGFDGLLQLRTRHPHLPVVVVSGHEDPKIISEALSYGAAGFVPKSVRKSDLAAAIRSVMEGAIHVPENYEARPPDAESADRAEMVRRLAKLTPQQLRVLQMLRQGLLNKQIAYELQVGETTVKAHVSEILRKLNVYSRTQAVIEVSKLDNAELFRDPSGF
jgi:DNA-binding NarL/FixJ family response regulator